MSKEDYFRSCYAIAVTVQEFRTAVGELCRDATYFQDYACRGRHSVLDKDLLIKPFGSKSSTQNQCTHQIIWCINNNDFRDRLQLKKSKKPYACVL